MKSDRIRTVNAGFVTDTKDGRKVRSQLRRKDKEKMKKATLRKTSEHWIIVLEYEDGDDLVYRFPTQTAARSWAYRAGVKLEK